MTSEHDTHDNTTTSTAVEDHRYGDEDDPPVHATESYRGEDVTVTPGDVDHDAGTTDPVGADPDDVDDASVVPAGADPDDDDGVRAEALPADVDDDAGPTDDDDTVNDPDVVPVPVATGDEPVTGAHDYDQADHDDEVMAVVAAADTTTPTDEDTDATPVADSPVAVAETVVLVEDADGLRQRWQALQVGFVDDPPAAVADAASLVGDVVERFVAALADQRDQLQSSWSGDGDTEQLRLALRRYRDFLERLIVA